MALQKKNVLLALQRGDEFEPSPGQSIVKYVKGVGNNLHMVEAYDGSQFLVTMPKKFRNVVYLAKGNCLVIDPIKEGNKVQGEIFCLLEPSSVTRLVESKLWPQPASESDLTRSRADISEFFLKEVEERAGPNARPMYPSSDSSDVESTEVESGQDESQDEGVDGDDESSVDPHNLEQTEPKKSYSHRK